MKKLLFILIILLCGLMISCRKTPVGVIEPHDMASLLADIHRAEGVVEMNRRTYSTDSSKQALMQAVYNRHNVTQEMVDTSFDWYGHHLDEYIKVYTEVMDILQQEIDQTDAVAARVQMAVVGDSVDTWGQSSRYVITKNSPNTNLSLMLYPDENWEPGDNYTLNFKVINALSPVKSLIGVEYEDNQIEWIENNLTESGKVKFDLISDSTKNMTKVFAAVMFSPVDNETIFIDSLSLIRTRVNRQIYSRRYNQKKIKVKEVLSDTDTIPTNE